VKMTGGRGRRAPRSTASRSTASKSTASKSTASKSTASKNTASKNTASRSMASKSMASKSMASKSTASKNTARKPTRTANKAGTHAKVAGSDRGAAPGARRVGAVPDDELVEVTVIVRPRSPLPDADAAGRRPLREREYVSRRAFTAAHGADPRSLAEVASFAATYGLTVQQSSAARRSVALSGPAGRMTEAFRTRLVRYRSPRGEHRGRSGPVQVPRRLAPVVEAVLGLDDRPQAHSKCHVIPPERMDRVKRRSFTPKRIAELYDFPSHLDGRGQRIAVIELGGGFSRLGLDRYFTSLGTKPPKVTTVWVDGARNRPGVDHEADNEVLGDIEVIGAVAPGAELLVYFAPLTDRGFVDALSTAIFDAREPSVISVSWGAPELEWTHQARLAIDNALRAAAALGITVCAATGDAGWTDGVAGRFAHVDYPASSPYVLACGGTSLALQDEAMTETVWNNHNGNATGGGVSAVYELPSWQRRANVPRSRVRGGRGRGVPDVAGNADPETGYLIGSGEANIGWGGTSAVAPLWAGLIACLNQGLGTRVGYLNPVLYETIGQTAFNDVPRGGNGAYRARRDRWDACTGHGTPRGSALLAALGT
jgi:kumamolisin